MGNIYPFKTLGEMEQQVIHRMMMKEMWRQNMNSVHDKLPPEHLIVRVKDISGRTYRAFRVGTQWFQSNTIVTHWIEDDRELEELAKDKPKGFGTICCGCHQSICICKENDRRIFWKTFRTGLLIAIFLIPIFLFLRKG